MTKAQDSFDEVKKSAEDSWSKLDAVSGRVIEIAKLRIGLWDKLGLLNAGTLGLSFTVAASFRGHAMGDGGVGYLFAAWKCLLCAIVLTLFAQSIGTLWYAEFFKVYMAGSAEFSLRRLHRDVEGTGALLDADSKSMPDNLKAIRNASSVLGERLDNFAATLGWLGQSSTVIGLFWLYKFARVNLVHL